MFILLNTFIALVHSAASFSILGSGHYSSICDTAECQKTAEHLIKWMDPTTDPCEDFYKFTCGRPQTDNNFTGRNDVVDLELKAILEEKHNANEPKCYRQVRQLYSLCMDENKITSREDEAIINFLRKMAKWPFLEDPWIEQDWDFIVSEINLVKYGLGGSLFKVSVSPDIANSSRYTLKIGEPNEHDDPTSKVSTMFPTFWDKPYDDDSKDNPDLLRKVFEKTGIEERKLLKLFIKANLFKHNLEKLFTGDECKEDEEDFSKNQYSVPQLQESFPWLDWTKMLQGIAPHYVNLEDNAVLFTCHQVYLKKLGKLLETTPKMDIANYMMSHTIMKLLPYVSFNLLKIIKPGMGRWSYCVQLTKTSGLSLSLASLLARKHIKDSYLSKEAFTMAKELQQQLVTDIGGITWLDEKTKRRAQNKIAATTFSMGYPSELSSPTNMENHYYKFHMDTSNYFEAMMDNLKWKQEEYWSQLTLSAKKNDWRYDTFRYLERNAYNALSKNFIEVTGPELIFKNLFNLKVPSYINYGDLGMTIGHELIHSLDNQGISYNETGDKENWWSKDSMAQFQERTQCFIDQYSAFNETTYTQMRLDGERTLGENMADNGGLKLAYHVYKIFTTKLQAPEPGLAGLEEYSPDQLFLLSAANFFCEVPDKNKIETQLRKDVHSPRKFRVNGEMMNSPVFSKAFGCTKGTPMNPADKCEIW